MKGRIQLTRMAFLAYHGYYPEEREQGGKFEVDVTLDVHIDSSGWQDEISGTLNYEKVYQLVAEEMAIPAKLLEHVVYRILNRICREFPQLEAAEVTLYKLNPPLRGPLREVSVTLHAHDLHAGF